MIFLTGSTGFLGRELLGRLLVSRPTERVCLIVRPTKRAAASQRVRELLTQMFGAALAAKFAQRIETISGDLDQERFGLGDAQFAELAAKIDVIYHCAASTALNESLEAARRANVGGTQQVVALARAAKVAGRTPVLHHVSTAYVAGDTQATVSPEELRASGAFKNAYEQSKAEAEQLIRALSPEISTTIFRPSMIVGDSITGQTSAFNVIYIPARYLVTGLVSMLPGRPNTPIDLVPVDYVADAIAALTEVPRASGSCFHLCSGVGRETTLREVIEQIAKAIHSYGTLRQMIFRAPQIVSPEMIHLAQASLGLLRQILHLLPYMARNPRFDVTSTTRALSGILPPPPLFREYSHRVFEYCFDTNWGKREWTNPQQLQTWFLRSTHSGVLVGA